MLLYRLKEHSEAILQADVLLRRHADAIEGSLYRAMAKQALGRVDAALADYKVVSGETRAPIRARVYALEAIAEVALSRHQYDGANAALEALSAIKPEAQVFLRQGEALEGLGQIERAEAAYRRSLGSARNASEL